MLSSCAVAASPDPIRILIADDHSLMRRGVRGLFDGLSAFTVVGEAKSGAEAVDAARELRPDVILMDLGMPDMDGVEAITRIMRECRTARVIAFTMHGDERFMLGAIRAGARAYLLKTMESADLLSAIEAVHRGEYLVDPVMAARVLGSLHLRAKPVAPDALTNTERAVLKLVAQGLDNRDIAAKLRYSEHTVSNRLRTIFDKLGVTNRTQATLYALRQGWASLDTPEA